MSAYRVASRYAKSLILFAQEKNVLDQTLNDVKTVKSTLEQSRPLKLALKNPVIRNTKKETILKAVFEKQVSALLIQYLEFVTHRNRADIVPEICNSFIDQYNKINGIQKANIFTAVPVNDSIKKSFQELLGRLDDKKFEVSYHLDADLIGGYLIRVDDKQIDESIQTKLNNIRKNLSKTQVINK